MQTKRFPGWSPHFENQLTDLERSERVIARVVMESRGYYHVAETPGDDWIVEVAGKLRHEAKRRADFPAVGDWVVMEPRSGVKRGTIHRLLERKTKLVRRQAGEEEEEQILASNVDVAFVVMSLNRDLNERRIERYLTVIGAGGVTPVVLLTKADLCEDVEEAVTRIRGVAKGIEIIVLSTLENQGVAAVAEYLVPGVSCVMLGSSGVGKSTLVNKLAGKEILATKEVRAYDDRGRHTTTARHLIVLPSGAVVIDTPGMRELQLTDVEEGLTQSFPELEDLSALCRFTNCGHNTEPGCAVNAALASGELDRARYENYLKLVRETAFEARKTDKGEDSRHKKGARTVNKAVRKFYKGRKNE